MGEGRILGLCRGGGEGLIEVVVVVVLVGEYGVEGALLLSLLLIFIYLFRYITRKVSPSPIKIR